MMLSNNRFFRRCSLSFFICVFIGHSSCVSQSPEIVPVTGEDAFSWADSEGVRNVLRRASQMAMIKWTPIRPVPHNLGFFDANSTVIGIPYSSVKQINKYIGFDVSYHTFMTAVHNSRSVLYTEDIGEAPYFGVNCACYYGTTCSAAVAFALDLKYPLPSVHFLLSPDFYEVELYDLEDLKPGDVLFQPPSHVFMIYRVERDDEGRVSHVTIFEAASIIAALSKLSSVSMLKKIENARLLRYIYLDEVNNYIPSKYVAVGDEPFVDIRYNESLCPNRGDRSVYRTDESVVINIFDTRYEYLILEKNGDVKYKKTIVGSDVDVGPIEPGLYSLYLSGKREDLVSDRVSIFVVEPKVSVSHEGGTRVTFECEDCIPTYCVIATKNGTYVSVHVITDEEREQGFVDLDAPEAGAFYCKVIFQTPYGTVINDPVLVTGYF